MIIESAQLKISINSLLKWDEHVYFVEATAFSSVTIGSASSANPSKKFSNKQLVSLTRNTNYGEVLLGVLQQANNMSDGSIYNVQ